MNENPYKPPRTPDRLSATKSIWQILVVSLNALLGLFWLSVLTFAVIYPAMESSIPTRDEFVRTATLGLFLSAATILAFRGCYVATLNRLREALQYTAWSVFGAMLSSSSWFL